MLGFIYDLGFLYDLLANLDARIYKASSNYPFYNLWQLVTMALIVHFSDLLKGIDFTFLSGNNGQQCAAITFLNLNLD